MNWRELARQKPCEIVLTGEKISQQLEDEGGQLNELIFGIRSLNFLDITQVTTLKSISPSIGKLHGNLTNLVLQGNKLPSIPDEIGNLHKLKTLDLSRNALTQLPEGLFAKLSSLQALNVEQNQLETLPDMSGLVGLLSFKFGSNQIKQFPSSLCDKIYKKELESQHSPVPIYGGGAVHLSELIGSHNQVESIPSSIRRLVVLKTLDLSDNKIVLIPKEIADCPKLAQLHLKDNPVKDRRLYKLIDQCPTKKVLDYIRANVPASKEVKEQDEKAASEAKTNKSEEDDALEVDFKATKSIHVQQRPDVFKVIVTKQILQQRKIVACILHNIDLTNPKVMKKFIQVQTKLHQGICDNRQKATIATHDLSKILPPPITFASTLATAGKPAAVQPPSEQPRVAYFDGRVPTKIRLQPLGRATEMTAMEMYRTLNEEADAYRKEKKRNTISGVHKYLHLLKGKALYPVLLDYTKEKVISLPPLTNADYTKIAANTTDVFVEVTGLSVPVCREVMNELIKQFLLIEAESSEEESGTTTMETIVPAQQDGTAGSLLIEPVVVETVEGELVVKYPAKIDLQFDNYTVELVSAKSR